MGKLICGRVIIFILAVLPLSAAQSDTLFGLYAGAGAWQQDYSGVVDSGTSMVDLEDDLGLGNDNSMVLYAAMEHGLPLLPNLRGQFLKLDVQGNNILSRTIDFNGETFSATEPLGTIIDLTQRDAVLYYQVIDQAVSFDFGMVVSLMKGSVEMASQAERSEAKFNEVVPMLFMKMRADIPRTGFWLGAQAQGVTYDGNKVAEFDAQIGWESKAGIGFEAGYRAVQIEFNNFDDIDHAEIDVQGPYAAINYHF